MSTALQFAQNFVNCGGCRTCGAALILEKTFYEARRQDHKNFFCPNGHSQYYPQTSDM